MKRISGTRNDKAKEYNASSHIEHTHTIRVSTMDDKLIRLRFQQMDLKTDLGDKTSHLSLDEIGELITESKRKARVQKQEAMLSKQGRLPYVPPGGWKMDPKTSLRITGKQHIVDPMEKGKKMTTIDRFREMQKSKVWQAPFNAPPELSKELWRLPQSDGTGHRIFNLSRDDDKSCVRWKPGPVDRPFEPPSLDLITPSFRDMLKRHVERAPELVKKELATLPDTTSTARDLKARIESDLHNLQMVKESVLAELTSVAESESSSVFEARGRR